MKGFKIAISGIHIFPLLGVKNNPPMNFNQKINNYTEEGRQIIHDKLSNINYKILEKLRIGNEYKSVEWNDIRVSKYTSQNGVCRITKLPLELDDMELHHIKPVSKGGKDTFQNCILIIKDMHKLIHIKDKNKINKYLIKYQFDKEILKRINKLRLEAGNTVIKIEDY